MPNQPKPNTKGHYISAIDDDLWVEVQATARTGKDRVVVVSVVAGESVSAAVRRFLEEYVK
jgi:hypothetical protein